jgi:hypothetical protein
MLLLLRLMLLLSGAVCCVLCAVHARRWCYTPGQDILTRLP